MCLALGCCISVLVMLSLAQHGMAWHRMVWYGLVWYRDSHKNGSKLLVGVRGGGRESGYLSL